MPSNSDNTPHQDQEDRKTETKSPTPQTPAQGESGSPLSETPQPGASQHASSQQTSSQQASCQTSATPSGAEPAAQESALSKAARTASARPLTAGERLKLRLLRLVASMIRMLGFGGIAALARFGGFCFWHLAPSRRKLAVNSIMQHLGKNEEEAKSIARQSFASNFQSFLEIVLAKKFSLYDNPRLEPLPEYFKQMMEDERPAVGVLGHLGAWELLAGFLSEMRLGRPSLIVVRSQKSAAINEFMRELRSSENSSAVGHRNASVDVTAALRAKGTAGFLVDHNTLRQEAVFLPFLGETAAVNVGPALLALRGKAVVYPLYLRRLPGNRYRMFALEPLDTTTLSGSVSERAGQIAQFYTNAMEEMVKSCPEQWFWMHKRWKTKPKP